MIIDYFLFGFFMIIYAKLGFVSSYNDNMIYIDTGHHSRRSCHRRHCACLVNLTKVSTLYSSVHGERTQGVRALLRNYRTSE